MGALVVVLRVLIGGGAPRGGGVRLGSFPVPRANATPRRALPPDAVFVRRYSNRTDRLRSSMPSYPWAGRGVV